MKINRTQLAAGAVLVTGVLAWASNASVLRAKGSLEGRPNVLTMKGSPFGRTLAVAMRGPVDVYWHQGEAHHVTAGGDESHDCADCASHDQSCSSHATEDTDSLRDAVHGTEGGKVRSWNLRNFALDQIAEWRKAFYTRTNPYGSTRIHEAFIMGETEKRLRLSYEMDPGNFSAYGSYFLFLSEALSAWEKEGKSGEVHARAQNAALRLSYQTVEFCRARENDPSALLTAAVAAHDHAHLLLAMRTPEAEAGARQFVALQDDCLREFRALKRRMVDEGAWDRIPGQRQLEMEVQEDLLKKYLQANISYLKSQFSHQTTQTTEPFPTS